MSLLTLLQDTADELGINRPSIVIGNTSKQVRQLLRALYNTADDLSSRNIDWPELIRTHTITLVSAQAAYPFPADFLHMVNNTAWNRDSGWPLYGPLSPQDYATEISAVSSVLANPHYTVRGSGTNELIIYPTPVAGDAGKILAFDYISNTWALPKAWTASTLFAANAYCSYNGNIYLTTAGGTTGATAPTHVTGSESDDAVTWTYQTYEYSTLTSDSDIFLLDERLLRLGTRIEWREMNRLPYADLQKKYNDEISPKATAKTGAKTLYIGGHRRGYQRPISVS